MSKSFISTLAARVRPRSLRKGRRPLPLVGGSDWWGHSVCGFEGEYAFVNKGDDAGRWPVPQASADKPAQFEG